MKNALSGVLALCALSTGAQAAGLDRSGQGINILFEEGEVVQFRLGFTDPSVSGSLGGASSGDIAHSFFTPHLAYKRSLSDRLDFALIYDEPFGADVTYSAAYPLSQNPIPGGRTGVLQADASTQALTALLRYKFDNGFSAIGGIRGQRAQATISAPAAAGYSVTTNAPVDFGYVLGVAWERPDIAARVALTYNSAIEHTLSQSESLNPPPPVPAGTLVTLPSSSTIETPQSVNLDFQTGIAPDTLLFGSVRWVDWPQLVYNPPNFPSGNNLVDYDDDTFTYTLGIGRKFSEAFSGALTLGYEASTRSTQSDLGPTDGFWSVGLGGTYSLEKAKITGGVRYTDLGDAITNNGARFTGNSAWSVGLQVTYALN
ncbi:transporter [Tropicibacter sp. R16_0]|uniref:OmpP1/FadL family transporter n=1 Tax=Tropicibacter sp. R16_0 TaxID=2821102 RepID=UPI001ADB0656|nr:transporter [Tropicibacter sp. R16_0]MBO9449483.1 transporter [Tropicibacter sp. R16_0]